VWLKTTKIKGRNPETQKWIICRWILVHRCWCSCTTVPCWYWPPQPIRKLRRKFRGVYLEYVIILCFMVEKYLKINKILKVKILEADGGQ